MALGRLPFLLEGEAALGSRDFEKMRSVIRFSGIQKDLAEIG
jgi:hypothetical protein